MIIVALLVTMILLPPLQTHAVSRKTQGKIILASILTGIAILTKLLEEQDRKDVEKLHKKLGTPDHVIEFHHGFDKIRIECWLPPRRGFERYLADEVGGFTGASDGDRVSMGDQGS